MTDINDIPNDVLYSVGEAMFKAMCPSEPMAFGFQPAPVRNFYILHASTVIQAFLKEMTQL